MKAVHPSMRRAGGGAIVNVSSMAAYIAVAPASAYTASKWGLRGPDQGRGASSSGPTASGSTRCTPG